MLKQRLLTAVILIPLVVGGILYLPEMAIAVIFGVLLLQGAWEWSRLTGLEQFFPRIIYVIAIAFTFLYLWPATDDRLLMLSYGYLALAWWLVAFLWICIPGLLKKESAINVSIKLACGALVLVPAWYALVSIHSIPGNGPLWLLYTIVLVWIADSGAYFAGKQWGRHKLAPNVSPGKTWEGVLGAFILVAVYCAFVTAWLPAKSGRLSALMIISLILVPVSVIGDLLESLMKRQAGVKDSGNLLPGHGGVLDRIDGLVAVLPLFMWSAIQVELF